MEDKNNNAKNGVIIIGLLIAIFMVGSTLPIFNDGKASSFGSSMNNLKGYISEKLNLEQSSGKDNYAETYEEYYSIVKEAVNNYEKSVNIVIRDYDTKIFKDDVYHKALEENPLATPSFSCLISTSKMGNTTMVTFQFEYPEPRAVLKEKDKAVRDKVKDIVKEVTTHDMKDYEKEKALHDYLVNNCRYDERLFEDNMPEESYTAYGALMNGTAVCQGYAIAMNLLLQEVGIEVKLITGYAWDDENSTYISHAWSLVNLDGDYYHLDPTWNDPVTSDGSDVIRYSYFNITDDQIQKTHSWERDKFPASNSYEYTFNNIGFVEEDMYGNEIIEVKNYEGFFAGIKSDIKEKKTSTTYKVLNFDNNPTTIEANINKAYEEAEIGGQYRYYYEQDPIFLCGYVTVEFIWE